MSRDDINDLLEEVDDARAICDELGIRRTTVVLRTRTWSSGKMQTGTSTTASTEILPRPHVDGSAGDPEIKLHITPKFTGGGYTPAQLAAGDVAGVESYFAVTFPDGVERAYALAPRGLDTTRPLRYTLRLLSLDRKVPF